VILFRGALLSVLFVACNFGVVQSPDRGGDSDVLGPPPPADFHCERGSREVRDSDRDGHPDQVVYLLTTGATLCSTEDLNHDGRIDRWNRVEDSKVVEQATDTDFDGKLDQRAVDTNKDGTMDLVTSIMTPPDAKAAKDGG
jgi:hypothetical protein